MFDHHIGGITSGSAPKMYHLTNDLITNNIELLDHTRREKIVLWPARISREYLSAGKAGGTWVPMVVAMTWWFLADRDIKRTSSLRGGVLWDCDDRGTYTVASITPSHVGKDYKDMTAQVEQELLEAESLAMPHHFERQGRRAEPPAGFLEKLREIWKKTR
jgi:hypothetical protein